MKINQSSCTNPDVGQLIFHFELGKLVDADRNRFEEHLLNCEFCQNEVEAMLPVANAIIANHAAIQAGLNTAGVSFKETQPQLESEQSVYRGPNGIKQLWRQIMGIFQTLKQKRVLWPAVYAAAGLVTVSVVLYFVILPKQTPTAKPYTPYLSFQILPYEGSLTLRGETVEGREMFDQGIEAYLRADYKQASKFLNRAVAKSSDQGEWWLYLGVCNYLQHEPSAAIKALQRADELLKGSAKIRASWFLAQSFLLNGEREKSEPLLEWVVAQNKDYSKEAFELIGKLHEVGSYEEGGENQPSVFLPSEGEVYLTGSVISIGWNDDQFELAQKYQIWLSTDGGITFPKLLVAGLSNSESVWDWFDADINGDHLCLRVCAVRSEAIVNGSRSKPFAVVVPPLFAVQAPRRDERWRFGIANAIEWTTIGASPQSFSIELYRSTSSGLEYVETLASDLSASSTKWVWKDERDAGETPEAGDHYRVKVIGTFQGRHVEGMNDGDLTLLAPGKIDIETVNAVTAEGDPLGFSWLSTQDDAISYTLQLCETEGVEGTTLERNLSGSATGWVWANAHPPGSYLLRVITHFPEGDVVTYSPNRFEIKQPSEHYASNTASAEKAPSAHASQEPLSLEQNHPNPFNAITTISFRLRQSGTVTLAVYNSIGQLVSTLVNSDLSAGEHSVPFDGQQLASGMYLYRLEMNSQVVQKKMILAK